VIISLVANISGNDLNATITGSVLTPEVISKMLSGNYYINVHTAANPGGEIRGQILPETDYAYSAMMDGAQEVPQVNTGAYGLGVFDLYQNYKALTIHVVVQGLSGAITGAHLHVGAPGVSGGVVQDLTTMVSGNVIEGEVDPTAYLSDLLAGNIYVNVHTADNPGGEIRGQLTTDANLAFDASLDGAQETPPVVTTASGVEIVKLNTTLDTLWYHVVADGLSATATGAHFHTGAPGISGPVVINTTADINGNRVDGFVTGTTLTPSVINSFLTGDMYFNMHTAANPGGEIRGQVYRYAREGYTFRMDGSQENPATNSTATGSGIVTMDRFQENVHLMVVVNGLSGSVTAAQFHKNVFGQNGGVIFEVTDWFSQTGTSDAAFGYWTDDDATPFTIASSNLFINDSVYINVHTAANPGGEIRGQVIRGADCFVTTVGVVGIASIGDQVSQFALYPNPVEGNVVNVNFESLTSASAKIQLVGITGNTVMSKEVSVTKGSNSERLTLTGLVPGIYLVKFSALNHSVVIGKFIKE